LDGQFNVFSHLSFGFFLLFQELLLNFGDARLVLSRGFLLGRGFFLDGEGLGGQSWEGVGVYLGRLVQGRNQWLRSFAFLGNLVLGNFEFLILLHDSSETL
jgi:hypothetical protein